MSKFQPRPIKPENVSVGCTVAVTTGYELGVSRTYTGRVHTIESDGAARFFFAQEGALIFAHTLGAQAPYKISLLDREPEPQTQLEGISF